MDVSHELGALRFVVDSSLSSKVAMFNQQVNQHKQSQLLNPFSQTDGRASPKPSFSKDEYGKPLAGSLTEMRGQKANMHVLKEMLELCQIIDSEGYNVKDEPTMRVIPFGELFNIYNYISDKVVGILLRARKHKLVEFEGEMLFQRRDDDVPIFLLKPIQEIRHELNEKIESIKRSGSASPQATSVLLDKKALGLNVPRGASPRSSVSPTPSPYGSKAPTPVREIAPPKIQVNEEKVEPQTKPQSSENQVLPTTEAKENSMPNQLPAAQTEVKAESNESSTPYETPAAQTEIKPEAKEDSIPNETPVAQTEIKPEAKENSTPNNTPVAQTEIKPEAKENSTQNETPAAQTDVKPEAKESPNPSETPVAQTEVKQDVNNNNDDMPTIVIEATAVYNGPAKTEETTTAPESNTTAPSDPIETAPSA